MSHRFSSSVLVEVTAWWEPDLGSFRASVQTRRGELKWETSQAARYPTIPSFKAALTSVGISMSANDMNRLQAEQDEAITAAARAEAARPAA